MVTPNMEAIRVHVNVVLLHWMKLKTHFIRAEEHVLDLAHLLPCRATIRETDAHVIPTVAPRKYDSCGAISFASDEVGEAATAIMA